MTPPDDLSPLLLPLAAVQRLLERFEGRGLIIGGVAAALLGAPRATADVDAVLLVSTDDLPALLQAATEVGLSARISDAEEFARQRRVLLLRHDQSGVNVDISLGMLPFEDEAVERGVTQEFGALRLRLPTVEDLIILKAVAHRPKDLLDIQALIRSHPDLDRPRVQFWVHQFAEALEAPEFWDDIAAWF